MSSLTAWWFFGVMRSKEVIPGLRAVATAMSPVSRTCYTRSYGEDAHVLVYRPSRRSLIQNVEQQSLYAQNSCTPKFHVGPGPMG